MFSLVTWNKIKVLTANSNKSKNGIVAEIFSRKDYRSNFRSSARSERANRPRRRGVSSASATCASAPSLKWRSIRVKQPSSSASTTLKENCKRSSSAAFGYRPFLYFTFPPNPLVRLHGIAQDSTMAIQMIMMSYPVYNPVYGLVIHHHAGIWQRMAQGSLRSSPRACCALRRLRVQSRTSVGRSRPRRHQRRNRHFQNGRNPPNRSGKYLNQDRTKLVTIIEPYCLVVSDRTAVDGDELRSRSSRKRNLWRTSRKHSTLSNQVNINSPN